MATVPATPAQQARWRADLLQSTQGQAPRGAGFHVLGPEALVGRWHLDPAPAACLTAFGWRVAALGGPVNSAFLSAAWRLDLVLHAGGVFWQPANDSALVTE